MQIKPTYEELEKKAAEIEEKFRSIFENSLDVIVYLDSQGTIVDINDKIYKIVGYKREEVIGKKFYELEYFHPEDIERSVDIFEGFIKGDQFPLMEFEIVRKKGEKVYIEITGRILKKQEKIDGAIVIIRDITKRKLTEIALKGSETKYRQLVNYAPVGIFEVDFIKEKFVTVNDVMCEYTGYTQEEFLLLSPYDLLTDDSRARFNQKLDKLFTGNKMPEVVEFKIKGKNNREFWVLLSSKFVYEGGKPKGARVVIHDITERKHAEEKKSKLEGQVRLAQKMEAIGTLAGGIAHDFNNILGAIMLNAEMAYDDLPEESDEKYSLQQVLNGCTRARDLVDQILTFSRDTEVERKTLNIAPVVKETLKMIRPLIPATVIIDQDVSSDLENIIADPVQIQQLVMNLCSNAAHAMREKGGMLTITLKNLTIEHPLPGSDIKPGAYVNLMIRDTGHGIPPDKRERIFDPFFTTKQPGEGTGLGLSVVHGIVVSNDGYIQVQSDPGVGTAFQIFFPSVDKSLTIEHEEQKTLHTGNEKILFVDDEEVIIDAGRRILERLGYSVVTAKSGIEALEVFASTPEAFDLVITDMTMPHMTGAELSEKLMRIRFDVPIILCTGYSYLITAEKAREVGIREFVMKPFTKHAIAETVRNVLDNKHMPSTGYDEIF